MDDQMLMLSTAAALAATLRPVNADAELVASALLRGDIACARDYAGSDTILRAVCAAASASAECPMEVAASMALGSLSEALGDAEDARGRVAMAMRAWQLQRALGPLLAALAAIGRAVEVRAAILVGYAPVGGVDAQEGDLDVLGLGEEYVVAFRAASAARYERAEARVRSCRDHNPRGRCGRCGVKQGSFLGSDAQLRLRVCETLRRAVVGPLQGYVGAEPTSQELLDRGWRSDRETYPRALAGAALGRWEHLLASVRGDLRALEAALAACATQGVRPLTRYELRGRDGDVDVLPVSESATGRRWTF